jgi:hypothetical protein
MNWGWGGTSDGFYREGNVTVKGNFVIDGKTYTEQTYSKNRKNLINITYKK